MDLELENKVVIVTGGAKGIGEAITRKLVEEGAIPVVIGRNEEDNTGLLKALKVHGNRGGQIVADLTQPGDCRQAVVSALQEFGRIDGLVNNAGLNDSVGLENGSYEGFLQSLHNNVVHYYLLAHYALPSLIKSQGSIVNISSKTADTGQGGTSGYAAANGGRNALTREWAVELLKYKIRVNAVSVAECWTPQYQSWISTLENPEITLKEIASRIPLENRMTSPAEIANTVLFLLSGRSSHTTGQIVHVDGGYVHLDRALLKK